MSLWKISRHCEFACHMALSGPAFIDGHILSKDPHYRWFMVAGCFQINRELYTYFRENRYDVNCTMDTELLSYGQSSMTLLVRMFKNSDGVALVTNSCAGVWVDTQKENPNLSLTGFGTSTEKKQTLNLIGSYHYWRLCMLSATILKYSTVT